MQNAADLADGEYAVVQVSGLESGLQTPTRDVGSKLLNARAVLFHLLYLDGESVVQNTGRVLEAAQNQRCAGLIQIPGYHFLPLAQGRRLFREEKAASDRRAFTPQHQRRGKTTSVADASAGNHRDVQRVDCRGPQGNGADIVLTDMAGRLRAVHDDRVTADLLGCFGMPDSRAFVNDGHAGSLHGFHIGFGCAAGGLHNADALFNADAHIGGIVGRGQGRHQGQIHGEGFFCQGPAFADLLTKLLRIRKGSRRHDAQTAGVRNGGDHFGFGEPLHRAEQNGPLDAKHAGNAGFEFSLHGREPHSRMFRTRRPCCSAA